MTRDDLHVAILTGLVATFYIGYLIHPTDVTSGLLQAAVGGLLTMLVTKSTTGAPKP